MRISKPYNDRLISHYIDEAVKHLDLGNVISFPTETHYGLGVDPFCNLAVEKLFNLKKRAKKKAILLLIADEYMLPQLVSSIPEIYKPLMKEFWPGPLTLLFPASAALSPLLTGGTNHIGIRVSSHPVAQKLCEKWNKPVTATSANISGMPPQNTAEGVRCALKGGVDYVIDGGATTAVKSSTIVGLCHDQSLRLVRSGKIEFEKILEFLGGE